eukprot:1592149-Rhodomonas_salina.1
MAKCGTERKIPSKRRGFALLSFRNSEEGFMPVMGLSECQAEPRSWNSRMSRDEMQQAARPPLQLRRRLQQKRRNPLPWGVERMDSKAENNSVVMAVPCADFRYRSIPKMTTVFGMPVLSNIFSVLNTSRNAHSRAGFPSAFTSFPRTKHNSNAHHILCPSEAAD